MNLTRRVYTTYNEKRRDFLIGLGGWFALNALLLGLGIGTMFLMSTLAGPMNYSEEYQNLVTLVSIILACLPCLINIGLMLYFAFSRYWIALGALGGWAIIVALVLCLGLVLVISGPPDFR